MWPVVRTNRQITERFTGDPVAILRQIAAHIESRRHPGYDVASITVTGDELVETGGALVAISGHMADVEWKWVGGSDEVSDGEADAEG